MKTIISNEYNLTDEDINEVVKRVKVLLINNNEVILGYSNHEYQFPGGHVKDGEELVDAINREVEEETGIKLNLKEAKPFARLYGYYKDWPKVGNNRKIEIYYYEIKTLEKPNLANTKLTNNEIKGNFELRTIPLSNIEEELTKNIQVYKDKHGITKEMLEVFRIYNDNIIVK